MSLLSYILRFYYYYYHYYHYYYYYYYYYYYSYFYLYISTMNFEKLFSLIFKLLYD
jgi:hypothetical protein